MTSTELKARIYDLLAQQQQIQLEIQKTQEELAKKLEEEAKEK